MKTKGLILTLLTALSLAACGENDKDETALDGYELIWNDEFDGDALDEAYWTYEIGGGGWGNNELEYYTNQNATVSDGILSITAKKRRDGWLFLHLKPH